MLNLKKMPPRQRNSAKKAIKPRVTKGRSEVNKFKPAKAQTIQQCGEFEDEPPFELPENQKEEWRTLIASTSHSSACTS